MFRSIFTIFARHHDFTAAELSAAESQLPEGWVLDKGASACAPATVGGWQAVLGLVGSDGRVAKVVSAVQADPAKARRDALESLPEAVQTREDDPGRRTQLVAEPPAPPGLRPSVIVSLRGLPGQAGAEAGRGWRAKEGASLTARG